jgi:ribosome-associated protein
MKPSQKRKTSPSSDNIVSLCLALAEEKKAEDIIIFDLSDVSAVTDYFFICHGTSDRKVQAIADNIMMEMKKKGHKILGVEGYPEGRWILIDFGDLVVHIFYEETRRFFELERLWEHAVQIHPPQEKAPR